MKKIFRKFTLLLLLVPFRLSLSGFPEFFAHFSQFFFDFFHVSYYNVGLYDSFD